MTKSTRLPEKLSDCIDLALADLRRVERSEKYRVDMASWHDPHADGRCVVCLAGAVMAQSLGARADRSRLPSQYGAHTGARLDALNDLAYNCVSIAVSLVTGIESPIPEIEVPSYESGRLAFHRALRRIAKLLREHRL